MATYREEQKKQERNRKVLRIVLLSVMFFVIIGVVITVAIVHKGSSEESYIPMSEASLPTVTLRYEENHETELHGYVNDMDLLAMRDVIVPLSGEKSLHVRLNTYGNVISELSYEVRSLDGAAFLDNGSVTDLPVSDNGTIDLDLRFSDLLVSGTEYHLILMVREGERLVRYYTRILYSRTNYVSELLEFTDTFSEATCDHEKADFIVPYLNPSEDATTTDYAYTDMTSKFVIFHYGSLAVERGKEVLLRITELEPTQLSLTYEYEIRMSAGGETRSYSVREFFVVRYRNRKVYLLDYKRTLEEHFQPELSTSEKGRVLLGSGSSAVKVANSSDNVYTVFVKDRSLWSYDAKTNTMALVFSFSSDTDGSNRSDFDHHDVEVVKVGDDGTIDFMVYGYMNRGVYEGTVGICFYRFHPENNAISRLFYMPVDQSEQILRMDLGTLAYVNSDDVCYLRYGDGIYSIDLNSGESVEVTIRAYPGMYAKNRKGNVVAWHEGEDLTYPDRLVILNMDSQTTVVVNAEEGEYIKILDFVGDDIIYGFGRSENSVISANIDINQLMFRVLIASTDEGLTVRKDYTDPASFILSVNVYDTRIVMRRVVKQANGDLSEIDPEVLLTTQVIDDNTGKSSVAGRVDDDFKREYYIQIGRTTNSDSQFSLVKPRFQRSAANVIALEHRQTDVYYVYGYGRVARVESAINVAVSEAYDLFGTVLDGHLNYVWTRGTRNLVKTISI
ncbi:MAG: hypothetical protein IKG97_03115, partial [Lachnospiraceae bacterium]|nr:hypothetical protein [Lachnospiraceae bacterium]